MRLPQREAANVSPIHARTSEPSPPIPARSEKLVDVEREHILTILDSTGWRIRGIDGAAERLGLKPTTLETRMAKLGVRRPTRRKVVERDANTPDPANTG